MKKMSVALILAAALLLGPAAGVSVAKSGGHMSGPHGGIGHPGHGAGALRMNRSTPFSGYRRHGVQNWAQRGPGNFRRHRGRGFAGFYPYYGDYYSYGYGGACGWLYAQAVANGSSYWWQHYYDCVGY
jgi:hypothetical protein